MLVGFDTDVNDIEFHLIIVRSLKDFIDKGDQAALSCLRLQKRKVEEETGNVWVEYNGTLHVFVRPLSLHTKRFNVKSDGRESFLHSSRCSDTRAEGTPHSCRQIRWSSNIY